VDYPHASAVIGKLHRRNGIIDWDDSEADVRIEVLLLPFFRGGRQLLYCSDGWS